MSSVDDPTSPARSICVCLSGGGHRATLFGLGALMYLVDADVHRRVTSIASVSGGSLTNGFVAQNLDFKGTDSKRFEEEVAGPLARQIAQKGTLFVPLFTKLYLAVLILGFFAAFLPLWLVPGAWWLRGLVFLLALLLWGWILGKRGAVCAHAFAVTLFSPRGKPTPLADTFREVDHVLCATELRSAQHVFFSSAFVYSFEIGLGVPADLPLYKAVQASAAFPGGFPPARFPTKRHEFGKASRKDPSPEKPDELILSDGGVYDNMGDEWARGFEARTGAWKGLAKEHARPDQLIVVNASARVPWSPFRGGAIPLVGEILALNRVNNVMYVNTTNVRRRDIVDSFDPLDPDNGHELPGALVQIAQSPFSVAGAYRHGESETARRARAVLEALGNNEKEKEEWAHIAAKNSRVPTTLRKLETPDSARLLYQGYVLAMCNLHVIFGEEKGAYPLLPMPDPARFETLAS